LALNVANAALHSGLSAGAVGAGIIEDASGAIRYPTFTVSSGTAFFTATHEVIQSGTLWNVAAVSGFGGFREDLGMDAVDAAACLALRQRGFNVLVDPQLTMRHRLGEAHQIQLFGHSVIRTGHGSQRRKAMVRNRLRLFPAEFRESPVHAIRTVRRAVVNQAISTIR
jgi:GT2 family glycosyltransferase